MHQSANRNTIGVVILVGIVFGAGLLIIYIKRPFFPNPAEKTADVRSQSIAEQNIVEKGFRNMPDPSRIRADSSNLRQIPISKVENEIRAAMKNAAVRAPLRVDSKLQTVAPPQNFHEALKIFAESGMPPLVRFWTEDSEFYYISTRYRNNSNPEAPDFSKGVAVEKSTGKMLSWPPEPDIEETRVFQKNGN